MVVGCCRPDQKHLSSQGPPASLSKWNHTELDIKGSLGERRKRVGKGHSRLCLELNSPFLVFQCSWKAGSVHSTYLLEKGRARITFLLLLFQWWHPGLWTAEHMLYHWTIPQVPNCNLGVQVHQDCCYCVRPIAFVKLLSKRSQLIL